MIKRIAENVRELFPNVNKLVNNLKKVFLKAPHHVEIYEEVMPNIPLPPEPILIRWSTWIGSATFCADHFESLKIIFTEKLNDTNVVSTKGS